MVNKVFTLGITNDWKGGQNFDVLKIGTHVCENCSVFLVKLAGFGIAIGYTTIITKI